MNTLLEKLIARKDLQPSEAETFLSEMLRGENSGEQLAAVLTALRMKGEAPDEILGFVRAMRGAMLNVDAPENAVDVCGTGGDGANTFNISTTVALVVAGAGVPVAKHGNRAASSSSGSADVLEALGVNINLTPQDAEQVLAKVGIVFLFAQQYHPAMKHVVPVRKALGIPTVFNLLGPFANPAKVRYQLVGVPNPEAAVVLVKVTRQLSYGRLLIASSSEGLDEIGLGGPTTIYKVENGDVEKMQVSPTELGFTKASIGDIQGGTAEENAAITRAILGGRRGAPRDIVVLNAGYALYAAKVVATPQEGIARANESIDSGAARLALDKLIKETKRYA